MKTTLFKNTFVVTAAIFMSMYAIPMYAQQEGLTNDKILSAVKVRTLPPKTRHVRAIRTESLSKEKPERGGVISQRI